MLKRNVAVSILFVVILMMTANPAGALDPIPNQAGFSGFIRPGVGYLDIETNMVAEFAGFELSSDPISSLTESNDSESTGIFLMPFNVAYTFGNLGTQVFLGTQLTDLARFDLTQQLGVKQKIGGLGLLQVGFVRSGIATEVWEDPYLVGLERSTTDRDLTGAQVVWGKIFGSDLELTLSFRSIDIDDEKSGQSVTPALSPAQLSLLERDGDQKSIEALYLFKLGGDHFLAPSVRFLVDDRDGDARANDAYSFKLTYSYLAQPCTVLLNGSIGKAEYDEVNPIFGKEQEDDLLGADLQILYTNPWGWTLGGSKPMRFFVSGGFLERDADIDFYDEKVATAQAGVFFRW
jgi:hypothetical protein